MKRGANEIERARRLRRLDARARRLADCHPGQRDERRTRAFIGKLKSEGKGTATMKGRGEAEFLSVRQVGEMLGITRQTVRAQLGGLPWVRIGPQTLRVRRADLDAFLERVRA